MNSRLTALGFFFMLMAALPGIAMNNYDDPRIVLSYMDKDLDPARDILRLHTDISDEQQLVFQVKMRGEGESASRGDYVLLQVWQERAHLWLVPLGSSDPGDRALAYEGSTALRGLSQTLESGEIDASLREADFTVKRISRGVEYAVPLEWLDYGQKVGFEAYTVRGRKTESSFVIEEIYDRAAKGDREQHIVSPIMLLNNLCATRK